MKGMGKVGGGGGGDVSWSEEEEEVEVGGVGFATANAAAAAGDLRKRRVLEGFGLGDGVSLSGDSSGRYSSSSSLS